MKEIKNKLGIWLLKKVVDLFKIDERTFYRTYYKVIDEKNRIEASKNFKGFYDMDKPGNKVETCIIKLK